MEKKRIAALVFVVLAAVGIYALRQKEENQRLRVANGRLNQMVDQLNGTVVQLRGELNALRVGRQQPTAVAPSTPAAAPVVQPKNVSKSAPPAPKMAEDKPPTAPALDSEFAREMTAAHNAARLKPGVPALAWSAKLAAAAQRWADTLAATGEFKMEGIAGQNIASAGPPGRFNATFIVQSWAAEGKNFDYEKNVCVDPSLKCYHYTQVVWRETKYVGCGMAHDAQRDIWVCDYDPPGNEVGVRPY